MVPCPTFRTLVYGLPVRGVQADRTLQGVHQFINVPVRATWPTGQEVHLEIQISIGLAF
jgi:hypothetical protein